MKKLFILLFVLVLGGCGSSADYLVSFPEADALVAGQEIPVKMVITQDDQPAVGLEVSATFEMKSMDHDTLEVSFTEEGNGSYVGKTLFPMSGEWQAYVTLSDEGKQEEVLVSITVKE